MPFSFAFIGLVGQTKIFPEEGAALGAQLLAGVGGVPFFVIFGLAGLAFSAVLAVALPVADDGGAAGETRALLGGAAHAPAHAEAGGGGGSGDAGAHGAHGSGWVGRAVEAVAGPTTHPRPTGALFFALLVLSFVMSLFWLLTIANELVGVVLAFGKVLGIPEIVMGLGFLAVGNSINDFAASVSIAREGYAQMAIAGAYAGPMFNIIAGIGLPMLIASGKAPDSRGAYIGGGLPAQAPIVWVA
jgi:hypothetical protein